MLGISDAEHEESSPDASHLVISKLTCSLVGKREAVRIAPGTKAFRAYGKNEAYEEFRCNYGLNPAYQKQFNASALVVAGTDLAGEYRIVELPGRRFYLATLFLPQLTSSPGAPHPLIVAYLDAARRRKGGA